MTPDRLAGRHVLMRPALRAGVENGARLSLVSFEAKVAWRRAAVERMPAHSPQFRLEA